jgi:hypothetical protein
MDPASTSLSHQTAWCLSGVEGRLTACPIRVNVFRPYTSSLARMEIWQCLRSTTHVIARLNPQSPAIAFARPCNGEYQV